MVEKDGHQAQGTAVLSLVYIYNMRTYTVAAFDSATQYVDTLSCGGGLDSTWVGACFVMLCVVD
jgi:hypothetical protein